jgi:putative MFS transporter
VPESPRWLIQKGRIDEARRSLAWALEMNPADLPTTTSAAPQASAKVRHLLRYPRSLAVSWLTNLGAQTGVYGFNLWAPTLLVLVLTVKPERAAFLMIWVTLAAIPGRVLMSYLSDALGRRRSGAIAGLGSATLLILAALSRDVFIGQVSLFWVMLIVTSFSIEGNFAIIGPYTAEVWPSALRTTGMGSAYGFGGLGKIIGPLGLALIVGSSNVVKPEASVDALLPAYAFLACWYLLDVAAFLVLGIETKGRTLEAIEADLSKQAGPGRTAADAR